MSESKGTGRKPFVQLNTDRPQLKKVVSNEVLIQHFQDRPQLYDRSISVRSKLKRKLWQDIAKKTGCNVSAKSLKNRMRKLRNRFCTETNRLAAMRDRGEQAESPWELYNRLQFLSEHVRLRGPRAPPATVFSHVDAPMEIESSPQESSKSGRSSSSEFIDVVGTPPMSEALELIEENRILREQILAEEASQDPSGP